MIVKNESRILERCFDSVAPWIAEWIIHDTGSTDDTASVIRNYWKSRDVPGRVVSVPWKNFGHNRSQLLKDAKNSKHYLLLADADHQYQFSSDFDPEQLSKSAYYVVQRDRIVYQNIRVVDPKRSWRYVGRTHEYIEATDKDQTYSEDVLTGVELRETYDGGNRSDKFERDLQLLLEELEESPKNSRAMFYLGQTCMDLGRAEEAEKWYYNASQQLYYDRMEWR